MIRGTRSRYCGSIRFSHRSGGSLAWLSVETMKYFLGSSAWAVRSHPVWPGVSRRHRFGALMATSLMLSSVLYRVPHVPAYIAWRRHYVVRTQPVGMKRGDRCL